MKICSRNFGLTGTKLRAIRTRAITAYPGRLDCATASWTPKMGTRGPTTWIETTTWRLFKSYTRNSDIYHAMMVLWKQDSKRWQSTVWMAYTSMHRVSCQLGHGPVRWALLLTTLNTQAPNLWLVSFMAPWFGI